MRILEENLQRNYVKLLVENFLDLWHLLSLIEIGDRITAKTLRMIFIERMGKKEKARRKLLTLTIRVEKMELREEAKKLRITGKIIEGPEEVQIGSYHSIDLGIGSVFWLKKDEWKEEKLKKLRETTRRKEKEAKLEILREFFLHLNKNDGLAIYGIEEVRKAAIAGAVKVLLVPLERMRDKEIEEIMREVEERRGEIKFITRRREIGEKFCNMYDIAAILRFRI